MKEGMRYEILIRANVYANDDGEALSIAEKRAGMFENGELVEVNKAPFGSLTVDKIYGK